MSSIYLVNYQLIIVVILIRFFSGFLLLQKLTNACNHLRALWSYLLKNGQNVGSNLISVGSKVNGKGPSEGYSYRCAYIVLSCVKKSQLFKVLPFYLNSRL